MSAFALKPTQRIAWIEQRMAEAAGLEMKLIYRNDDLRLLAFKKLSDDGQIVLAGYHGSRKASDFQHAFPSATGAQQFMNRWIANCQRIARIRQQVRAEQKAQRAKGHALAVGDVLSAAWGCRQIHVDYYQVTRLAGTRLAEIRQIARQTEETSYMEGVCMPLKDRFIGAPMLKQVDLFEGAPCIKISGNRLAHKIETQKIAGIEIFQPDHWMEFA
ncbi:MAG: hypothetical protein LBI48_09625 [Burkholderiaceae bacterium]|nr:hypothetical protein [Burkholderiaceae bacterium]